MEFNRYIAVGLFIQLSCSLTITNAYNLSIGNYKLLHQNVY